jgi:hypothetical protein
MQLLTRSLAMYYGDYFDRDKWASLHTDVKMRPNSSDSRVELVFGPGRRGVVKSYQSVILCGRRFSIQKNPNAVGNCRFAWRYGVQAGRSVNVTLYPGMPANCFQYMIGLSLCINVDDAIVSCRYLAGII